MAQPDIERLQLAFAWHLSQQVVDADGLVHPAESEFLDRHFPREKLAAHGLIDDQGRFTDAFGEAVEQALTVLPGALSIDDKRRLMGILAEAARAEGHTAEAESNVLIVAARILGLRPDEFLGG